MVFDEQFIHRIYRTTLWVAAVGLIWCFGLRQPLAALGLLFGTLVGLASLRMLECTVKKTLDPSRESLEGGFPLAKYTLLKYPAYLVLFVPVVLSKSIPLIVGFMGGIGLVHIVIILKAVGQIILQRMEKQEEV